MVLQKVVQVKALFFLTKATLSKQVSLIKASCLVKSVDRICAGNVTLTSYIAIKGSIHHWCTLYIYVKRQKTKTKRFTLDKRQHFLM